MLGPLTAHGKPAGRVVSYVQIDPQAGVLWLTGQAPFHTTDVLFESSLDLQSRGSRITIALAPMGFSGAGCQPAIFSQGEFTL